jgi:CRP/FNR family transcriptional regulator
MDLTFLLKSCRLFADLDPQEVKTVQQISVRKEFRKGQIIFTEGEPARGFYVVASGGVKIFRVARDGRERVIHIIEAGETFAEAAMFMEEYPASAEALHATTVIVVEKNGFKQLLAHEPRLSFKVIGALVHWLNFMRKALTDLTLKEVPARFASYVISLPSTANRPITVSVSKTTMAQMIGTTKETFSRLLGRMSRHRVLTYRGNQIRILNRDRLEAIARGDEKI